ncbi:MAG: hypothetical protein AAF827_16420 [Cyanobacteria bacterium P01_D01_bin.6]
MPICRSISKTGIPHGGIAIALMQMWASRSPTGFDVHTWQGIEGCGWHC